VAPDNITPLLLTFDEEANIGRTLDSLRWANEVVVLDSGSTDQTEAIARGYENVRWLVRAFDTHQAQWEHGIRSSGITTDYILALDADMQVSEALLREIETEFLASGQAGGLIPFQYRFFGHPLAGSLCPPQVRLFQRGAVNVAQLDHTQSFEVSGKVYSFRNRLIHDDRKSLERWVESQLRYQVLNEKTLWDDGYGPFKAFLRKLGLMPPIVGLLAYLKAGGPFYGAAAARYAYERAICESLLAMRIMNTKLAQHNSSSRNGDS
jgi:glycosyltransferase involved in cell wall biosynthesis